MLKYAVASVVLTLGFAVSLPPTSAAPRDADGVTVAPPKPYDSEEPARIRQEMDRGRTPEAVTDVPATQYAPVKQSAPVSQRAPVVEHSVATPARECADCPPPRHYDSTEVVKNSRDVDQSRVINTESVVQIPPRTREINKLVIQENETRNVGVVQHNHRIIEKEIRYVRRAPVYRRPVHQYVPQYRPVQQVQTVLVPVAAPQVSSCGCPCTCSGGHNAYASASTYVYQPGVAYDAQRGSMQKVWVPVAVPTGYGYR
jgi:hypothetical protein